MQSLPPYLRLLIAFYILSHFHTRLQQFFFKFDFFMQNILTVSGSAQRKTGPPMMNHQPSGLITNCGKGTYARSFAAAFPFSF